MKKLLILSALIALQACAGMDAERRCEERAGPKPYPAAEAFGIIGVAVVSYSDERQAWYTSMDNCMDAWRAERDAQ